MELTERQEEIVRGWGNTVGDRWNLVGDERLLLNELRKRENAREEAAQEARLDALEVPVVLTGSEIKRLRYYIEKESREEGSGPMSESLRAKLVVDLDDDPRDW